MIGTGSIASAMATDTASAASCFGCGGFPTTTSPRHALNDGAAVDVAKFRMLARAARLASDRHDAAQASLKAAQEELLAAREADDQARSALDVYAWEQAEVLGKE